jgi:hypothetical protein
MIRVYFVFGDPLDDAGINLSFADVPTSDPAKALKRVHDAARTGELWQILYPDSTEHPYTLVPGKMIYLNISALPGEYTVETALAI